MGVMENHNVSDHYTEPEFSSEYLPALFASFLCFCSLMYVASPFLSARYVSTYNTLSSFEKADWNTRMVSNINAVVVSALSVYLMFADEAISTDKVWGTSQLARLNVCIICGFLLADGVALISWFPFSESWIFLIHHFLVLYPFLNNVVYGALTFFANFRITTECSTLFVNIRWFMVVLQYKSSKWYILNGITMAIVFFLCRIASIPLYYAVAYQDLGRALASLPFAFIVAWLPSSMAMDVINTYWFQKIYRGAVKAVWGPKKSQDGVVIRNRIKGE